MARIYLNNKDLEVISSLKNILVDEEEIAVIDKILKQEAKHKEHDNNLAREYKRKKRKENKYYGRSKKQMEYNGWTNRDTWLVRIWLDGDYNNYQRLSNYVKGLGIKAEDRIDTISGEDLKYKFRTSYHFGDEINWEMVNIEEIRSSIIEDTKEDE